MEKRRGAGGQVWNRPMGSRGFCGKLITGGGKRGTPEWVDRYTVDA